MQRFLVILPCSEDFLLHFHASFFPEADFRCGFWSKRGFPFGFCTDVLEGNCPCTECSRWHDTNRIVVDRRVLGNTDQCFANKFKSVNDVSNAKLLKIWVQLSQLIAPVGICRVLGGWRSVALINHGSLWPVLVNLPLFYGVWGGVQGLMTIYSLTAIGHLLAHCQRPLGALDAPASS